MNPELPPPFPDPPPPQQKKHTVRNVLIGCATAFRIVVGLCALILIEVCSSLGNMH